MTASGATLELLTQAADIVTTTRLVSVRMLQRRLRISTGVALRVLDDLQMLGIIGPAVDSDPGSVLLTRSEAMALMAERTPR